jgi:flagellar export protein FliJ
MKRFSFPLDRVLSWRRTQQRLEEVKLEGIHAEVRLIDAQAAALEGEWNALQLLPVPGGFSSLELAARDQFRKHLTREQQRLADVRRAVEKRLDDQKNELTRKRRDVKLLEKIRQRRWEAWNRAATNEIDLQAAESALFRWTRVQ